MGAIRTSVAVILAAGLIVVATACSGPAESLSGNWRLDSGHDSAGPFELAGQNVTLDIRDSKVSGTAACNYYGGALTGSRDSVVISNLAQTAMACADARKMELESRYLTALMAVHTARATATELTLGGHGIVLVFHPASK